MMKTFLIAGLLSGSRFKTAARGYESRNEPTSFTAKRTESASSIRRRCEQTYTRPGRHLLPEPNIQTLQDTSCVSGGQRNRWDASEGCDGQGHLSQNSLTSMHEKKHCRQLSKTRVARAKL